MPIKIAIADDSAAIRSTLRMIIESNTDWDLCGEAPDGEAAVFLAQRFKPDLMILDLSMPVMNGLDAARKIACISPATRMVLFTAHACEQLSRDADSVGIRAVIAKNGKDTVERLISTLRHEAGTPVAA